MLGVIQTITENVLALFQNDGRKIFESHIINRKIRYVDVTTILHVVH